MESICLYVIFSYLCRSPFRRYGLNHSQKQDYGNSLHKSRATLWLSFLVLFTCVKYIENITWLRGNMKFISSVEQDISRVSAANE